MLRKIKKLFTKAPSPRTEVVKITCYGWHDNDPPGADIAYPILHEKAGGVGTYDDPITFAGNYHVFPQGTIIYIHYFSKYFIMEDVCGAAMKRNRNKFSSKTELPIVDIWIGGSEDSDKEKLIEAENKYTHEQATIIVNPRNGYTVNPMKLFRD